MEATTTISTWDGTTATTDPTMWVTTTASPMPRPTFEPIKTRHLRATARIHRATIETKDASKLMQDIKSKLIKDLMKQLESQANAIKITKTTNPKTYSVTFEAIIEYVPNET